MSLEFHMRPGDLRRAREGAGLTQQQVADRLGVSQAYWAFIESGKRRVPERLFRKLARVLDLPVTALPLEDPGNWTPDAIASALAGLGYPGFSWRKRGKPRNPAAVLVAALLRSDLEYRLAEALPWLVATFPALDWDLVIARVKLADVQNRLGFVVQLALSRNRKAVALRGVLNRLERARLVREEALGRAPVSDRERTWLRQHRSPEAKHWNLLTDLRPESLPNVS